MAKTKKVKFGGVAFAFNRLWCYSNPFFSKGKRKKKNVSGIVIHNTGNERDRAISNAKYFLNNKERYAGAHFVIDKQGIIYQCGRLKDICHSVEGACYSRELFYRTLNNTNTISIELCDIVKSDVSKAQLEALKCVIHYIRKYCKNANIICRHFDINGKKCPVHYLDEKKWKAFKKEINVY